MTDIPSEFDNIRPYAPEELPQIIGELFDDPQFQGVAKAFYPETPLSDLKAAALSCRTSLDIQKKLFYPLVKRLLGQCAASCTLNAAPELDRKGNYTFVSNHRDIVLDSALLAVMMLDCGFDNTVEIAIGDNLLIHPWIKRLVRVNKSFIVRRSAGLRETLECSRVMSRYMHFAIEQKHENIWIAQREGRAKDSNDRTQESVLKMMAMGGAGSPCERLEAMNIVPVSISYEYDPCDFLKAKEFQQKRDCPDFRKSREDDLRNMQTGIFGQKGHVYYHLAPCINRWLPQLRELPKAELYKETARRMDQEIHRGYRLYAGNYVAADLLDGSAKHAGRYTAEEKHRFETYIASRIALIDLPHRDDDFLRERLLTMYANPVKNKEAAEA